MVSMQEIQEAFAQEAAMSQHELDELMRYAPDGATPAQRMEMAFLAEVSADITVPGGIELSLPTALRSYFDLHVEQIGAGD